LSKTPATRRVHLVLAGPEETEALSSAIAPLLGAGDTIILNGALATGKTTFVKGLLASLGSADVVTSPTYAIAHIYESPGFKVLHVDAYRLKSSDEFRDLGLEDYANEVVTLVEWGEKLEIAREHMLTINFESFEHDEFKRHVTIDARGDRWSANDNLFDAVAKVAAT
jgi:tRNA threonylcarbamoyladenosine biosynthesis protein TsaE